MSSTNNSLDIDECATGQALCQQKCVNTPGSFTCRCPVGYELQADGISCKDIDECTQGVCHGADKLCVNTMGSFKCQSIECPRNYVLDRNHKK